MNRTIGVENGLTPVMEYLSEKGFQVEGINLSSEYTKNIDRYDAVIVTGMNRNFLGVQDIVSKIPVIDARGLSAQEVYDQLNTSLSQ